MNKIPLALIRYMSGTLFVSTLSAPVLANEKVSTPVAVKKLLINGFNEPRQALVFTKGGNYLWVLNKDLSLSKVDRKQQKIVATIKE